MTNFKATDFLTTPTIPGKYTFPFEMDFSQLEVGILALLSEDPKLLELLNSGGDIHTKNYANLYGVPEDEVTPEQRRFAKARSFELQYGASAQGMARNAGIGIPECQDFIDRYYETYKCVREWHNKLISTVYTNGFKLRGGAMSIEKSPGSMDRITAGIGTYTSPLGRIFTFQPFPSNYTKSFKDVETGVVHSIDWQYSVPQIKNYMCQGTGYDVVQLFRNALISKIGWNYDHIVLSNEVHDSEQGFLITDRDVLDGASVHTFLSLIRESLIETVDRLYHTYKWESAKLLTFRLEVKNKIYPKTSLTFKGGGDAMITNTVEYKFGDDIND